jgi:hypothetical protein
MGTNANPRTASTVPAYNGSPLPRYLAEGASKFRMRFEVAKVTRNPNHIADSDVATSAISVPGLMLHFVGA